MDRREHSNRIFRVAGEFSHNGENKGLGTSFSPLLAEHIKANFPEIVDFVRFRDISWMNNSITYKSPNEINTFDESDVYLVDGSLFEILDVSFQYGNATKFDEPNKMILASSVAEKYFGDLNPVGQKVILSGNLGEHAYEIVGIFNTN